jgi:hypothetical protein
MLCPAAPTGFGHPAHETRSGICFSVLDDPHRTPSLYIPDWGNFYVLVCIRVGWLGFSCFRFPSRLDKPTRLRSHYRRASPHHPCSVKAEEHHVVSEIRQSLRYSRSGGGHHGGWIRLVPLWNSVMQSLVSYGVNPMVISRHWPNDGHSVGGEWRCAGVHPGTQ